MYRCIDCGEFFPEPIEIYDDPSPIGVSLPQGAYVEHRCPFCGSEWVEEAGVCASCKEPIEAGKTLCDDCKQGLADTLGELADEMGITYDIMEDAVREIYEV